jgi:hypothetical protein
LEDGRTKLGLTSTEGLHGPVESGGTPKAARLSICTPPTNPGRLPSLLSPWLFPSAPSARPAPGALSTSYLGGLADDSLLFPSLTGDGPPALPCPFVVELEEEGRGLTPASGEWLRECGAEVVVLILTTAGTAERVLGPAVGGLEEEEDGMGASSSEPSEP